MRLWEEVESIRKELALVKHRSEIMETMHAIVELDQSLVKETSRHSNVGCIYAWT